MRFRLRLVAFFLLMSSCKCTKDDEAPAPAASAAASTPPAPPARPRGSADASAKSAPWTAVPSATAMSLLNMGMPERFELERNARPPKIEPNAEAVFAALAKTGLTIVDQKQHLASPFGARYCAGARAVDGEKTLLWLSVCEYVTAELAKSASEYSEETLSPSIPFRKVYSNKQTGLIMRLDQDKPENQDASKKAVDAYSKL